MITLLIVRDSWLRASHPVVLVVVVVKVASSATATAAAASTARLLAGRVLRPTGLGRRLIRGRVDLVHVTVAIVRNADLTPVQIGQRGRIIVLHQVLVLQVIVRVLGHVVDIFHLATGSPAAVAATSTATARVSTPT